VECNQELWGTCSFISQLKFIKRTSATSLLNLHSKLNSFAIVDTN